MLPQAFKARMSAILGDEYDMFIRALEQGTAVKAFRANLIKTDGKDPFSHDDGNVDSIPIGYCDNGYIVSGDIKMGNTPEHHAGMIYMQDPGAMATACAVEVTPDMRVADLCAAPGGKSGQIAERLGEGGFLLSNEYVPKRAKIIVGNLERLGVKCAAVTSLDTSVLAELYPGYFDLVIVDAPCSGEGMFRKSDEALDEWSEENVAACAERQKDIIANGAAMVRPGGMLLYSTCTYSEEENEQVVEHLLGIRSDFTLTDVNERVRKVTRDGIRRESYHKEITKCRRFYPHLTPGEGQFIALLKRDEASGGDGSVCRDKLTPLGKKETELASAFLMQTIGHIPRGRLVKCADNIVLITHNSPLPPHSVFMPGVLIGELKGSTIKPSHQFFSAFGNEFLNKEELSEDTVRLSAYLRGEEIDALGGQGGWCAVTYHGAALGGGKISGGRLKNHYPKGLRLN